MACTLTDTQIIRSYVFPLFCCEHVRARCAHAANLLARRANMFFSVTCLVLGTQSVTANYPTYVAVVVLLYARQANMFLVLSVSLPT